MGKKARKPGRPQLFSERLAARVFEEAQKPGATDELIAERIGISVGTLNNWKGSHPGFLEALNVCKNVANQLVESALFSRAVGYSHPAVRIHYDSDSGRFVTQEYTEHYPPDVTACSFWLKNRDKKRWVDVQKHEHAGTLKFEDLVPGHPEPKK